MLSDPQARAVFVLGLLVIQDRTSLHLYTRPSERLIPELEVAFHQSNLN